MWTNFRSCGSSVLELSHLIKVSKQIPISTGENATFFVLVHQSFIWNAEIKLLEVNSVVYTVNRVILQTGSQCGFKLASPIDWKGNQESDC